MLFTSFYNIFTNLLENPNPSFLKGAGKKNAQIHKKTIYAGKWIGRKAQMGKEEEK